MNLFKALSYKEWVKTRKFVFVVLLLLAAVTVYAYIDVTYSIRVNEAVNVWYGFIFQGMSVSGLMMYLMPLSGIAMAIVQFVPEMTNKRLKLTLHLPASETRLVSAMLLFGYGVLLVLYLASMGLLSLRSYMHDGIPIASVGHGRTCWIRFYSMDMCRAQLETATV